jgi:integrase
MAPRRKARSLPNGIKPDAIPSGVSWDTTGLGRWVMRHKADGKLRSIRLGGPDTTLGQLWAAFESARTVHATTMATLVADFEQSIDWSDLAKASQDDYRYCAKAILSAETRSGRLVAETNPRDWTPGTVRGYVDRRGLSSRSRANHELRYLCRLFAWAREREIVLSNPADGVRGLKVQTKARYVEDGEYLAFLKQARPLYLAPAAELAYLCRLRLSEVLDLQRRHITERGLTTNRRKGSKDGLALWTPRLKAAVDASLALHGHISGLYLIPSETRGRMSETTFKRAWGRAMRAWAAAGNQRWMFHDAKRKGVTDFVGDKLAASGHRSAAMLRLYDLSRSEAEATR